MNLLLLIPAVLTGAGLSGGVALAPPVTPTLSYLAVAAGGFDVVDNHSEQAEADLRIEYRAATPLYQRGAMQLLPFAGIELTSAAALYGLGGLIAEVRFGGWNLSPGLAVGAYENGSGRKLGFPLEFRSQFEVGRELPNRHRIAVSIAHISNADLGRQNPGVEVISLYYLYPLR